MRERTLAEVYHWHPDVGTAGDRNCSIDNGHHPHCSYGILTPNNMKSDGCNDERKGPVGKQHRCIHVVPAGTLEELEAEPGDVDIWVAEQA
jgi:hypothetical protein